MAKYVLHRHVDSRSLLNLFSLSPLSQQNEANAPQITYTAFHFLSFR